MPEPAISIIIPTYNSERTLRDCLSSIREQEYPQDQIEILIIDGGSEDTTKEIAAEFNTTFLNNPLRTAEAAKAIGVKHTEKPFIALIDSDNVLPEKTWFQKMMKPLEDNEIVASEPIEYTYRKEDNLLTRYSALLGMVDPLCLFTKNYDRMNAITNTWTELPRYEEKFKDYIRITFTDLIPTIGANGTIIRTEILKDFLKKQEKDDYLFDIDALSDVMLTSKKKFAKVHTGMIHIFAGDVKTFAKKQRRRIQDYLYFQKERNRTYPWEKVQKKSSIIKFSIYTILIIPTTLQALKGYMKIRDIAWFFYPIACLITLWIYGTTVIRHKFVPVKELDREKWKQ